MSSSIRSRLLVLMAATLLPGAAAALWLIAQTVSAERQAHERSLRDTARALSMVIDRELSQRATVARILALSSELDAAPDLDASRLAQFEQQARRAMAGMAGWVQLSAGDRVLVDTRGQPAAAASAAGALVDAPAIDPPVQRGVLDSVFVYPVQRGGRSLLNVSVSILPVELQRIVDEQKLPPDRFGTVIDSRGTVVARHPGGAAFAGRSATPDMRAQINARSEGLFESVSLDGTETLAYFKTSPQGWTYISAMRRPQFASTLPAAVLKVAAGAMLLLTLAGAGAILVARRIADPVIALKDTAQRMKAGLPVAPQPTGIAECDAVAAALAEAASSIHAGRAELEHRVAAAIERTRAAEQRVAQSQRLEALGRLTGGVAHDFNNLKTGGVAHDFNNLLGVISNSAHVIQRHPDGAGLQRPVAAMLRAVEGGSRLTQHLQRIAGLRSVRPQWLDLGRHLPELNELLASVLGQRIALEVTVAAGTRPVFVDASELELALLNLALNARDALAAGGHVWLQARNAGPDDGAGLPPAPYVLITFTDDGSGMEAELAERVFEPFFTTKRVGKGTGLGLSQVHGFCVQAGGTARLGSTPGLGTTVSLLLPADSPASVPALLPPQKPDADTRGLSSRRVLLVEDNTELAAITATLLESYGCVVETTERADHALQRLQQGGQFDVVLSDIVMPGEIDGLGLARALRQHQPQLPVVLMCGYSEALATVNDFDVLRKPYDAPQLLERLQAAISAAAPA